MITDKIFAEGVLQSVKEYLPPELQEVECSVVEKRNNNDVVMTGIMFKMPDKDIAPVIYVSPFYDKIKHGEPVSEVIEEIADCFMENYECQELLQGLNFLEFDNIKQYIEPALINTRANQKMLSQIPHQKIEDLSVIYKVVLPSGNEGGKPSMTINNNLAEIWGISNEEIHKAALENALRNHPAVLQDMETIMQEIYSHEVSEENLLESQDKINYGEMFILSNPNRDDGATVLAYPDLVKQVDEKFDGGCYILPSSIHECIVVPKRLGRSAKELGMMVREVNATAVEREQVLSDRVYEFDREKNCLSQVVSSIDRGRENQR